MEPKREIDCLGVTIRSEANGDTYTGGSPEQVVVKRDLHILGIPAVQDNLVRMGAQQELGNLPTGSERGGRINKRVELAVLMAGQEQENFIGKTLNVFFLGEHLRGYFSSSRGGFGSRARIIIGTGADKYSWHN